MYRESYNHNIRSLLAMVCSFQELFRLLAHGELDIPDGQVSARSVLLDLLAGGMAADHTILVRLAEDFNTATEATSTLL